MNVSTRQSDILDWSSLYEDTQTLERKKVEHVVEMLDRREFMLESMQEWNIIPYGKPSECREHLLVIVDGKTAVDDILRRVLKHLLVLCPLTNVILFYVQIPISDWVRCWEVYETQFDKIEAEGCNINVRFRKGGRIC